MNHAIHGGFNCPGPSTVHRPSPDVGLEPLRFPLPQTVNVGSRPGRVGSSEDKATCPLVWGAKVRGAQPNWQAGIAPAMEIAPHKGHPTLPPPVNVLDDDPPWGVCADKTCIFPPQARARGRDARALSRNTEILTRKPAHNALMGGECGYTLYVPELGHVWPVVGKDSLAERINLGLRYRGPPCALEAKIESPYTGEQGHKPHDTRLRTGPGRVKRPGMARAVGCG